MVIQSQVITKFLQSVTEVYYKGRQVLQNTSGITKCDRLLPQCASGITKCDKLLLQSASGTTKCDRLLQSASGITIATVLLNKIFDFSIKIFFQIIFCSYKILVIFLLQT